MSILSTSAETEGLFRGVLRPEVLAEEKLLELNPRDIKLSLGRSNLLLVGVEPVAILNIKRIIPLVSLIV